MKKLILSMMILCLILSCSGIKLNLESFIKDKLFNKKNTSGTIVAKIDNIPVTLQEIRDEMKYNLGYDFSETAVEKMMSNPDVQKAYEDKIINQYLVMKEVLNTKLIKSDDFEKFLYMSIKETIVKYYLYKKFFNVKENEKWKDLMVTTNEEVQNFYKTNKKYFDEKNISEEDALFAIKTDLEKRKNEMFLYEITNFQNNLVNELKAKYKVEKINN